jgi:hypothetical protein
MPKDYTTTSKGSVSLSAAKRLFGPSLRKLTPTLARSLAKARKVVKTVSGQKWTMAQEEKMSVAQRMKLLEKHKVLRLQASRKKTELALELGKLSYNAYLYKGEFVTGSGADPIYCFVRNEGSRSTRSKTKSHRKSKSHRSRRTRNKNKNKTNKSRTKRKR